MKQKLYSVFLIPLLAIASACCVIQPVVATSLPIKAQYDWSEKTIEFNQVYVWDNVVSTSYEKGWDNRTESYSTVYEDQYGIENPETYFEYERSGYYEEYVESYAQTNMTGNMTNSFSLDVFQVEASYGDSLQFIWMATKKCDWSRDLWMLEMASFSNYTYKLYVNETITWTERYHENDSIASVEIQTIEGLASEFFDETLVPSSETYYHLVSQNTFTAPLIVTTQVYETQDGDQVAWMDAFYKYIVFNDTDGNGIYSKGLSDSGSGFGLGSTEEWRGDICPMAISTNSNIWVYYRENDSLVSTPGFGSILFPGDVTVEELSNGIVFTPPTASGNTISWDIEYPDYPIYGNVYADSEYDGCVYQNYAFNYDTLEYIYLNHSQASPGDYRFGFDYEIGRTSSEFDYTLELPKISNQSFYEGVNGWGLSMPHYTFLMASSEIEQEDSTLVFKPAGLFNFQIGGVNVAEMDMANPIKENYTLFDYPFVGTNSEFSSRGGTVSRLVINSVEQDVLFQSGAGGLSSIVFSLEEMVSDDPAFEDSHDLYSIETQNYPIWSGEKLVHDPIFNTYYVTPEFDEESISGYIFIPLLVVTTISILIVFKRINSRKKNK